MPTPFETVDAFLAESDFDTQLWCDGYGWETAREMLMKLGEADWERLEREFAGRGRLWRGCLGEALDPKMHPAASRILRRLTRDPDEEVAYLTVYYNGRQLGHERLTPELREDYRNAMKGASPSNQEHLQRMLDWVEREAAEGGAGGSGSGAAG